MFRLEEKAIGRRSGSEPIETTSVTRVLRSAPLLDRPSGSAVADKTLEAGGLIEACEDLRGSESNEFASVEDGELTLYAKFSALAAP